MAVSLFSLSIGSFFHPLFFVILPSPPIHSLLLYGQRVVKCCVCCMPFTFVTEGEHKTHNGTDGKTGSEMELSAVVFLFSFCN